MRFAFFFCLACVSAHLSAEDFDVYYLGGQSNMDGYGFNSELPDDLRTEMSGVYIFHGNAAADGQAADGRGKWEVLGPGHGVGFRSDGKENKHSDRFGAELSLARALMAENPKRRVAIIKYSRGGTSIAEEAAGNFGCWEPDYQQGEGRGINQYDHFLATLRHAFAKSDIDGDGEEDRLIPAGIVWMQGESDGFDNRKVAAAYADNLKRLMNLIRAALRQDDLPVVIGRISDSGQDPQDGKVWDYGDLIRQAQQDFVNADIAAELVVATDEYGYSDKWHYDSAGYLDLGQQFAKALLRLSANR